MRDDPKLKHEDEPLDEDAFEGTEEVEGDAETDDGDGEFEDGTDTSLDPDMLRELNG